MAELDLKKYAKSFHQERVRVRQEIKERPMPEVKLDESKLQRRKGYVYYAGDGHGRIKIGFSINPWARIKEMRRFNPSMTILATEKDDGGHVSEQYYSLEKRRHQQFKDDHLALEWFKESTVLLTHIKKLNGEIDEFSQ